MTEFKQRDKNDILGMPVLGFMFKNKLFIQGLKIIILGLFLYGIYLGLAEQSDENTYTKYLFWGLFWPFFMVITLASMGRVFCGICPHGFIGEYITRLGLKKNMPNFLQNRFIGLMLVIIFWWAIYYAFPSFLRTPLATALFFIIFTLIAIIIFFLYKEMSYCKYICPIGSLTRAYQRISSTWLGAYLEDCKQCKNFECVDACSYGLKPLTFDKKNSMDDCTLCMNCVQSCQSISFKFKKPSFSMFKKINKYERVEVWVFILITAAITITMNFHHALGRSAIANDFIWSRSADFIKKFVDLGPIDLVGIFAFLYAMAISIGVVYIGMYIASRILNTTFEKAFYTLGYSFAPIFIIGGLSHLLHSFFTHNYANIANGFIYGFGLDMPTVANLASREDAWLNIFNYFPYIAAIWGYLILYKRISFFDASKVKKTLAFIFASSLITLFLSINFYKIYVYKTYGLARDNHNHSMIEQKTLPNNKNVLLVKVDR